MRRAPDLRKLSHLAAVLALLESMESLWTTHRSFLSTRKLAGIEESGGSPEKTPKIYESFTMTGTNGKMFTFDNSIELAEAKDAGTQSHWDATPPMSPVMPFHALTAPVYQSNGLRIGIVAELRHAQDSEWLCVVRISNAGPSKISYDDIVLTAYDDQGVPIAVIPPPKEYAGPLVGVSIGGGTLSAPYGLRPKKGQTPGKIDFSLKGEPHTFTLVKDAHPWPFPEDDGRYEDVAAVIKRVHVPGMTNSHAWPFPP